MAIDRRNFLKLGALSGVAISIDKVLFLENVFGANSDNWKDKKKLDGLYSVIAKDIKEGKPLIISNHIGLWIDGKPPDKNLYWGALYGHKSMFDRAKTDKHIAKNFKFHNWEVIYSNSNEEDPLETRVYKMEVNPTENWKEKGVTKPFSILQVYQVYENIYSAGVDMFLNLKQDKGKKIKLSDNKMIDLGKDSRIVGYIGHNYMMDFIGAVKMAKRSSKATKGSFAIGCDTADYFKNFSEKGEYQLLYTTSFMAPEGYNSLALTDGIAQGLSGKELAKYCNKAYRYFQVLGGQKRPGPLFVNHTHGMFR